MNKNIPAQLAEVSGSVEFSNLASESQLLRENVCRICLDGGSASKRLIAPCKCSGSVRYIHEECLKTWILSQIEYLSRARCELCLHEFHMNYEMVRKLDVRNFCKERTTQCLFTPLLLLVFFVIGLVIYYIAIKFTTNISKKETAYNSVLLLVCVTAATIIILAIVKAMKDTCCKWKMIEWNIESCMSACNITEELSSLNNVTRIEDNAGNTSSKTQRIERVQRTFQCNENPETDPRDGRHSVQGREVSFSAPISRIRTMPIPDRSFF